MDHTLWFIIDSNIKGGLTLFLIYIFFFFFFFKKKKSENLPVLPIN